MEELAKKYNFKNVEEKRYSFWEDNALFHGQINPDKNPFSIVIPPPNVTGILHMGHALNNTIQDILIRYKKMSGLETLWMPGTDHAGIATQNVVERKIAKKGLKRQDLGREKFLEQVWQWKQEYGSTIIKQLKHLGCACDWQRTRFTMDEGYSNAVLEAFIHLHEKGLIYRGNYIINWCPRCQTALSDEEAPHRDVKGFLYYVKYPLKGSKDYIRVATTRPETMLGDTAVAVNPKDKRYAQYIGRKVILPLMEREIEIIADNLVDPAFGTGAVKVTPAHDPNDYVMGKRHNLEFINILNPDGSCNENAGDYTGSDRFEAREAIIEDLKARKLLEKIEPHEHAVGHCYRCHTVIEPYYSKQWFVKMKPLAEPGIKAVKQGKIKFYPQRWTKVYLNWIENIQDWCISRQIWWGHRLPVYYCPECLDENDDKKGVYVSRSKLEKCPDCGSAEIFQDEDVLDTWFSSWLWPFATFGWPFNQKTDDGKQKTAKEELKYFYPTSVLVTAPEIIFFWVARMIMAGFEFLGDIPFKDVYIHGTVRDETGKKMSKSLGNSIDPLEIIDVYGTDALRFSLISITAMGQDVFLAKDKFEFGRNFANKIWNASRFLLLNINKNNEVSSLDSVKDELNDFDKWILSCFNSSLKKINKALSAYKLNEAAKTIYEFFWHDFCDCYIECAKQTISNKNTQAVLYAILEKILRVLHPFMPMITDEVWQKLTGSEQSVMMQEWPKLESKFIDKTLEDKGTKFNAGVTLARNLRKDQKGQIDFEIFEDNDDLRGFYQKNLAVFKKLAKAAEVKFLTDNIPSASGCASGVSAGTVVYAKIEGVDSAEDKQRIKKQIAELKNHIQRKEKLLKNKNYTTKAPAAVVEKERQSLKELRQELEKLQMIENAQQ